MPKVTLVSYFFEENYAKYQQQKEILLSLLKPKINPVIEHIGSTAIPETIGKGMVDISVGVKSWDEVLLARDILLKNGFREGSNSQERANRVFLCNNNNTTNAGDIHIHITILDTDEFLDPIYFRDALLSNPSLVKKYNHIKKSISQTVDNDRKAYKQKKGVWINSVIKNQKERL